MSTGQRSKSEREIEMHRTRPHHALAVPLPAQGHLNPLMRFCKLLAAHGSFIVTFVNIDPIHRRIQEVNHAQNSHERDPEAEEDPNESNGTCKIRQAHIPIDGVDLADDFCISFENFFDAQNSIGPHLEALLLKLNHDGPPVTCLISDIAMTIPTQKVADRFNIPRIVFYPNPASLQLLVSYVIQGQRTSVQQVMKGLRSSKTEIFSDTLPGLPPLRNKDLPDFKHVEDDNLFMWQLISQTWQQSESRAHAIVINSFDKLEAPIFKALSEGFRLPVYGIGPLVEPLGQETSLWKEDEACIAWLDKQPPLSVLYISFGSITILTHRQFEEILAGLMLSRQRFLWAFRRDLIEGRTSHSSSAADKLKLECNGKGYVVEWAPQLEVLSHPSVGGFLTHCGWNSVIEAIAHGLPMLCWPYFADQLLIAKFVVEEWKVGLPLNSNKSVVIERGEIERAIKALMEGEEGLHLRHNVLRLKEAGHQGLLPGGSSYDNMETLIKSLDDLQGQK